MGIKLSNNAFGTLAASINSSATSITLTTGQGARFPSLSAGDYFYATLIDTSNNLEIVKCTARSTDVLTVTRAQESTTARAYSTGDRIEIRLTAQTFIDAVNEIGPTQVSDENNTSTGYFDLPSGTTAERPGSPTVGMIRFNTTLNLVEGYHATDGWVALSNTFQASGGTETTYSSGGTLYKLHTFNSSGSFVVSSGTKNVDYLIVGGGGGGGAQTGGGGGAGGVLSGTTSVSVGSYTITVGAGGNKAPAQSTPPGASSGGNSSAIGLTAIGGGGGGSYQGTTINADSTGKSGGSGGGGAALDNTSGPGGSGTSGQGNAGGSGAPGLSNSSRYFGGGGGGATAAGANYNGTTGGGAGGNGVSISITGSAVTYGGGGGGCGQSSFPGGAGGSGGGGAGGNDTQAGVNGTANTGGGGGGGRDFGGVGGGAANGGSGIVIIRYAI